jgi:hypothetical protein
MESYQQRVIDEKAHLDASLEKLVEFADSERFATISLEQQALLASQASVMQHLSTLLAISIHYFELENSAASGDENPGQAETAAQVDPDADLDEPLGTPACNLGEACESCQ